MAGNIKGIIVEIGGDTSKLQDALKKHVESLAPKQDSGAKQPGSTK